MVRFPVVIAEKTEEMERKMEAKREVEVALVDRRLVKVEVAEEVAVMTPAVMEPEVKLPIDEVETYSLEA